MTNPTRSGMPLSTSPVIVSCGTIRKSLFSGSFQSITRSVSSVGSPSSSRYSTLTPSLRSRYTSRFACAGAIAPRSLTIASTANPTASPSTPGLSRPSAASSRGRRTTSAVVSRPKVSAFAFVYPNAVNRAIGGVLDRGLLGVATHRPPFPWVSRRGGFVGGMPGSTPEVEDQPFSIFGRSGELFGISEGLPGSGFRRLV